MTDSHYDVQVKQVSLVPKGWFSRLIWRFVRYEVPNDMPIYLTLVPPPKTKLVLQAMWAEFPADGEAEQFLAKVEQNPHD